MTQYGLQLAGGSTSWLALDPSSETIRKGKRSSHQKKDELYSVLRGGIFSS